MWDEIAMVDGVRPRASIFEGRGWEVDHRDGAGGALRVKEVSFDTVKQCKGSIEGSDEIQHLP